MSAKVSTWADYEEPPDDIGEADPDFRPIDPELSLLFLNAGAAPAVAQLKLVEQRLSEALARSSELAADAASNQNAKTHREKERLKLALAPAFRQLRHSFPDPNYGVNKWANELAAHMAGAGADQRITELLNRLRADGVWDGTSYAKSTIANWYKGQSADEIAGQNQTDHAEKIAHLRPLLQRVGAEVLATQAEANDSSSTRKANAKPALIRHLVEWLQGPIWEYDEPFDSEFEAEANRVTQLLFPDGQLDASLLGEWFAAFSFEELTGLEVPQPG